MVLQFAREDIAVVRRLRIPGDRWAFAVPLTFPETGRWNARAVNESELFACGPGSEFYGFDPAGTEFAIITVSRPSTAAVLAHGFLAGASDCTLQLRAHDAQRLHGQLRTAMQAAGFDKVSRVRDCVAAALDGCLLHAVKSRDGMNVSAAHHRVVRRTEEYFQLHLGESMSMARLSSKAMLSERGLRAAFYNVYATSPMRYLRLWQLHRARRMLRSPEHRHATVTEVATMHGFVELGRFARDYKALFGEVPSATLRRAGALLQPSPISTVSARRLACRCRRPSLAARSAEA